MVSRADVPIPGGAAEDCGVRPGVREPGPDSKPGVIPFVPQRSLHLPSGSRASYGLDPLAAPAHSMGNGPCVKNILVADVTMKRVSLGKADVLTRRTLLSLVCSRSSALGT